MGRTKSRFFKDTKPPEVVKTYKIDKNTTIQKLDNGVELVEEDYSDDLERKRLSYPQKVYRALHPGGRQDCKVVMSRVSTRAKNKG